MKFKLRNVLLPAAALGLAAAPILTATSCSNIDHLFFTVKNEKGLEVEFCDNGASIYSIRLGKEYITYHPTDKNTFVDKSKTPYYYGKVLGRVAGRFADGKLKIDDNEYQLQVNETGAPKHNCLHGGYDAWSFQNFKRYVKEDKANKCQYVAFNYWSPENEAGFPEAVDAWVVYTIYNEVNRIDTTLFAIPTGKTVINMSTHSLFRLGNSGDVKDYKLTIPTDYRVEYSKEESGKKTTDQTVKGIKAVTEDGGIFNFKTAKKIGADLEKAAKFDPVSNGYDHIWYFGNVAQTNDRYVLLQNEAKNLQLKVTALDPAVTGFILYANDYPRENQKMQGDDKQDTQYAGITIEPYTYFSSYKGDATKGEVGIEPIIHTPDNPFYSKFSYEIGKIS